MSAPDQRLFAADLQSAPFRIGAFKGRWGIAEESARPSNTEWPRVFFWIAAAKRAAGPERFYVALDVKSYRSVPPTGTFWDPEAHVILPFGKRPKGRQNGRVARVFRTDWNNGTAFYHPYDRIAAEGHPNWKQEQRHLVWSEAHTIVDVLEELHGLLNSGEYLGV
jgi:hypothetical protein